MDLAENGLEALDAIKQNHYDLVLMDLQMPGMDGFEATRTLRNGQEFGDKMAIPIIALTANAMAEDRERCIRAGMDDYLPKPINRGDLARKLAHFLSD